MCGGVCARSPRPAPRTPAMKVRSAVKLMCKKCKMVRRGKKVQVICPENVRHKQRQGFATLAGAPAGGEIPFGVGFASCPPASLPRLLLQPLCTLSVAPVHTR